MDFGRGLESRCDCCWKIFPSPKSLTSHQRNSSRCKALREDTSFTSIPAELSLGSSYDNRAESPPGGNRNEIPVEEEFQEPPDNESQFVFHNNQLPEDDNNLSTEDDNSVQLVRPHPTFDTRREMYLAVMSFNNDNAISKKDCRRLLRVVNHPEFQLENIQAWRSWHDIESYGRDAFGPDQLGWCKGIVTLEGIPSLEFQHCHALKVSKCQY